MRRRPWILLDSISGVAQVVSGIIFKTFYYGETAAADIDERIKCKFYRVLPYAPSWNTSETRTKNSCISLLLEAFQCCVFLWVNSFVCWLLFTEYAIPAHLWRSWRHGQWIRLFFCSFEFVFVFIHMLLKKKPVSLSDVSVCDYKFLWTKILHWLLSFIEYLNTEECLQKIFHVKTTFHTSLLWSCLHLFIFLLSLGSLLKDPLKSATLTALTDIF